MRAASRPVHRQLHHRAALRGLEAAYGEVTRVLSGLDAGDAARPTRAAGWTVADVAFHLLRDAQRALVALASPADSPADLDHVGYWRARALDRDRAAAAAHARHVRLGSAAYPDPAVLFGDWARTAGATLRAAAAAPAAGVVTAGCHALAVPDLLAVLAVEATTRHLDLVVDLPGRPGPRPAATELAARTLDGLLDPTLPRPAWDETTWILKGSGRLPLTADERAALGETAGRFPLLA